MDYVQRNWVRASSHAQALGQRRLTRNLANVDAYGIMAFRSGKKWHEFDLHADRPLDVIDAIRKVNAISMPSGRPPDPAQPVCGAHFRDDRFTFGRGDRRLPRQCLVHRAPRSSCAAASVPR